MEKQRLEVDSNTWFETVIKGHLIVNVTEDMALTKAE